MLNRRGFLGGLAGILSSGVAPAIVTAPMKIWAPKPPDFTLDDSAPVTRLVPNGKSPLFDLQQEIDIAWQHKRDMEKAIFHGMNYSMGVAEFIKSSIFRALPEGTNPYAAMLAAVESQRNQRGNH